ncbi:extracellular solute-binding protein, partial [Candidatus Poribacteria bacterium]|nr:extracellular solute-binding protein [Candidatus Poribacteria bacterium]
MKKFDTFWVAFVVFAFMAFTPFVYAQKTLTIAWAEWPPADYLQALSKDFTAETGIKVEVVQIPWPSFQDGVFTAFVGKSDRYDIVVGDSQWLGRNSVGGHYIDLTDWISKNIDVNSIYGPAMTAFAEYPKESKRYWALPAEVDANGYVYRKDLFDNPKEKQAFKAKYGYELAPPKTYKELRDIAEFFTRPPGLYGIATYFSK